MIWNPLSTNITTQVYYLATNKHCYLCNAPSKNKICEYCSPYLSINDTHCQRCSRPTKVHLILCGHCQKDRRKQQITKIVAPLKYDDIVSHLIKSIKFQQQTYFLHILIPYLCSALQKHYATTDWPDEIIPIPNHPERIKQRGFCQTNLIAKFIQRYLKRDIKINTRSLKKTLNTPAQHTLNKKMREKSQKNAYTVTNKIGKHVALIDDVITTGSTTDACALELFRHGVEKIDVWTLARTP
ncbi:ComF family protein [Marinomonas sp. 2405UD68-3]|uniref:ComF family protein n=1 Tax=Marinomonas sp. 2405UD68-3 TaxID=3391835 RepID=UPI0039C8CC42